MFAATQKKDKQALKEKENAWQQRMEHTARLRALRLAKEAADKKKGAIVKSCVWADHAAARSWRSPSTNLTPRIISAR